jgi:hypothetical protein
MIRRRLAVATLLALAAVAAAVAQVQPKQPLLVYTSEGGFTPGPFFIHLTVYRTGESILSRISLAAPKGKICQASATAARIGKLSADLGTAGAFALQGSAGIPDIPLSTVTYFVPIHGTRTRANTFSYNGGSGPYAEVQTIVNTFITELFGGC